MRPIQSPLGMTLVEVTFTAGLFATACAVAAPNLLAGLDDIRTRSAVRYLSGVLQEARMTAVTRSVNTAVRFVRSGDTFTFTTHADGNGDGIRTADIEGSVDPTIRAEDGLSRHFRDVELGARAGLPPVESGGTPPGDDPVRLGVSNLLAFTPAGTATPGSLYILGRRHQYVIRILGETGRTRVLVFDEQRQQWRPL